MQYKQIPAVHQSPLASTKIDLSQETSCQNLSLTSINLDPPVKLILEAAVSRAFGSPVVLQEADAVRADQLAVGVGYFYTVPPSSLPDIQWFHGQVDQEHSEKLAVLAGIRVQQQSGYANFEITINSLSQNTSYSMSGVDAHLGLHYRHLMDASLVSLASVYNRHRSVLESVGSAYDLPKFRNSEITLVSQDLLRLRRLVHLIDEEDFSVSDGMAQLLAASELLSDRAEEAVSAAANLDRRTYIALWSSLMADAVNLEGISNQNWLKSSFQSVIAFGAMTLMRAGFLGNDFFSRFLQELEDGSHLKDTFRLFAALKIAKALQ